jgi:hypothetical protein
MESVNRKGLSWLKEKFPTDTKVSSRPAGVIPNSITAINQPEVNLYAPHHRAILNRNTPRALLTDVQVANIMFELWKPHRSKPYTLKYPVTLQLASKLSFRERNVIFIPINTGAHWILVTFDYPRMELLLFDSCGSKPPYLKKLISSLRNVPPNVTADFVHQRLQFDGFQCGIWISWAFNSIVTHLNTNDSILSFDPSLYTDDSPKHDVWIAAMRDSYTTRLEEAFAENSLGYLG